MNHTLCMLTFGDHVELARRCLNGIGVALRGAGRNHVRDLRIGVNKPSPRMLAFLQDYARLIGDLLGVKTRLYIADNNQYKYPIMRRMLREPVAPAKYVGWLDDDAYWEIIARTEEWWQELETALSKDSMVGKLYKLPCQGNQWLWIENQPWFKPESGFAEQVYYQQPRQTKPTFRFCQGSCWFTTTELLYKLDWPVKDLRHCGGDSLLGEAYRQQGWTLGKFETGIHFNADWQGNHSKMPRRGYTEPECGRDFRKDAPVDHSHHDFQVTIEEY